MSGLYTTKCLVSRVGSWLSIQLIRPSRKLYSGSRSWNIGSKRLSSQSTPSGWYGNLTPFGLGLGVCRNVPSSPALANDNWIQH